MFAVLRRIARAVGVAVPLSVFLASCSSSTDAEVSAITPIVDDTAIPGDDDSSAATSTPPDVTTSPGDDDSSNDPGFTPPFGDDDVSFPGDDDASFPSGDDDTEPGDDDGDPGDDDTEPGDDDDTTDLPGTPYPGEVKTGFFITGSFPQDGSMLVPQQLMVEVYFSKPYPYDPSNPDLCGLDLISGQLKGAQYGTTVNLTDPILSEDQLSVGFPVSLESQDYKFELSVEINGTPETCPFLDATWPVSYEVTFRTDLVCGPTFNIYNQLEVISLGEDPTSARLLNTLLEDSSSEYPTALMMYGLPGNLYFPVPSFTSGVTGVQQNDNGTYSIPRDTGITGSISDCSIAEDGTFAGYSDRAVFPIDLYSTTTVFLYVERANLSAEVVSSGNIRDMNDFVLTGIVLGNDLYQLFASAGYSQFYEGVDLDVDTDGDGLEDAANIELHSDPAAITLTDCQ